MCDCRINASKWDLSVLHEGAAALQLSENFCSEGHRQSLDTVQFFENFYSLWGFCFWFYFLVAVVCLFWGFFCHLPPFSLCLSLSLFLFLFFFGKVQPQITFLLDLSLSVLKWPIYTEVNRQTAQQCSGPSYSSAPTRVDFAGGGENGSIVALAVWKRTASFCGMPSSF